jgi:hypothetical protein
MEYESVVGCGEINVCGSRADKLRGLDAIMRHATKRHFSINSRHIGADKRHIDVGSRRLSADFRNFPHDSEFRYSEPSLEAVCVLRLDVAQITGKRQFMC